MNLKIGTQEYKVKEVNAYFPIKFYKETGFDIFSIEKLMREDFIKGYEMLVSLAFHLIEYDGVFDDFVKEVGISGIVESAEDIFKVLNENSAPKVKSASTSKK